MLKAYTDTITALATPKGIGSVAVIRISGSDAIRIIKKITRRERFAPNTIIFCKFYNSQNLIIDEGLISFFATPKSFTGEDVVEINCHGGFTTVHDLINVILEHGARLATKGEFSLRAFLNGKMDLTQAESIIDLIESKSSLSSKISISHMDGVLKSNIQKLRNTVLDLVSQMEVALDYPEEDIAHASNLKEALSILEAEISALLHTFHTGKLLKDGIVMAVIGKPNVGKSSLLNGLLREDRAIVSDIPGTTRDTIEEWLQLDDVSYRIIDTAGIRIGQDLIENLGIEKTQKFIEKSELILLMLDAETGITAEDKQVLQLTASKKRIILINKTDVENNKSQEIQAFLKSESIAVPVVEVSLLEEQNTQKLEAIISNFVKTDMLSLTKESTFINNERHKEKLLEAKEHLQNVFASLAKHLPDDFLLIDLRQVLSALGEITGEDISDEVLESIFSRFCVGK